LGYCEIIIYYIIYLLLLRDNEREQLLLEYFEDTYIYDKPVMRLLGRIKPQRHPALFLIDM
jgi:hypothetical protein